MLADWLTLFLPPLAILALVSAQTGLNDHFRYVFPVLPFLFIIASGGMLPVANRERLSVSLTGSALLIASVTASINNFPNSIAYFNLAARLACQDSPILLGSSVDWGQDLYLIKEFYDAKIAPERLLYAHVSGYDPNDLGLSCEPIGFGHGWSSKLASELREDRTPRWVAISVNRLFDDTGQFASLRQVKPDYMIGSTTMMFRLDERDKGISDGL